MANFTNQPISESYDRVLQIDGGILQNGFGIPPVSVRIESLTVPNGIIGNLQGTATIAETASFTISASHAITAVTSSFSLTASYLSGSIETASFAVSASRAVTASLALSSSYIFNLQEVTSRGGITSASVSILGTPLSGSATASFNEGRFDILGDTASGIAYSASFNSGSGATLIKVSNITGSVSASVSESIDTVATFEQYSDRYSWSLLDNVNDSTASISALISSSGTSSIDIVADQINITGILNATASYIFNLQEVTSKGGITSASVSILGAPLSGSSTASFDAGKFEIVGDTANGLVYSASFNSGSNSGETVIKVTQLSGSVNTVSTFEHYNDRYAWSLLNNSSSLSASISADISNPLTSSINITASEVGILGKLNATASNAISSSYAVTASFLNHTSSLFEVHVCTNTGTDETGSAATGSISRGTLLYPYKTIDYAVSQSSAGYRIIVHKGVYNETVVLTNANTSIVGYEAGNGALTEISGLTVDVASSSTRVSNIKINTLVHQNTAPLFLNNVQVSTQATLNGNSVELSDCRVEAASGISKTTAGSVFVQNSTFYPLTLNHVSASVNLKNLISTVQPTVQAGTLNIIDTVVYPALSGSAAIVSSPGSTVSLVNSQVVDADGTPQRINIGGFLNYSDSVFDQRNSNLGTLAPVTVRFIDIEGRNLTLTGSLLMTGSLVVQGKITAREIETQLVSSSILFESGSTKFGDSLDDIHQFTGSLQITGSVSGSFVGDGSGLTGIKTFISSSLPVSQSLGTLAFDTTEETLYVVTDDSGSWTIAGGGGGASVILSASAPVSESLGTLWFNTEVDRANGGELYILVNETSSNWIPVFDNFTNRSLSSSYAETATTASHAISASYALTASSAVSSSFSTTASSLTPLSQSVALTGSLNILGNLNVIGTSSFTSVTASNILVDQNTITVFGSGSSLPTAGYIAVDTASMSNSGSLLYNFTNRGWESSSPFTASAFHGTASFATTASFAVTSSHAISASYALTASSAVSSSRTISSSFALTSSFVNPLNQNLIVTGSITARSTIESSFSLGDSGGEFVLAKSQTNNTLSGTGILIDSFQNRIRIRENGGTFRGGYFDITSLAANAATNLIGEQSTYIKANKALQQFVLNDNPVQVINFTNIVTQNAAEWNAGDGVFTATKSGIYRVTFSLQLESGTWSAGNQLVSRILKNGTQVDSASYFLPASYTGFMSTIIAHSMISVIPGDTIAPGAYHLSGALRTIQPGQNTSIIIEELPIRIQR